MNILRYTSAFLLSAALLTGAASCSKRTVTRVEPNKVIDLSGRWNETDARLCAESLVSQALGGDWLGNFSNAQKRKPVVVVGLVRNNSHEHLDTEIFTKDVEKAFIKSTMIRLVTAGEKRNELRGERADQQADLIAQQDAYSGAYADIASQNSQASTADPYSSDNEDDGELDGNHGGADNGCIDFDTIETYTANVQNKKRIFADEILRT
jgi:hypothetical protein